jgi:hypothetical protein
MGSEALPLGEDELDPGGAPIAWDIERRKTRKSTRPFKQMDISRKCMRASGLCDPGREDLGALYVI